MLDDLKILLERTKIEEHTLVHTNQDDFKYQIELQEKKRNETDGKKGEIIKVKYIFMGVFIAFFSLLGFGVMADIESATRTNMDYGYGVLFLMMLCGIAIGIFGAVIEYRERRELKERAGYMNGKNYHNREARYRDDADDRYNEEFERFDDSDPNPPVRRNSSNRRRQLK